MFEIKKYLNNRIDSGKFPSTDELIEKTLSYNYVSFDIFDTLLKRNIPDPNDLFEIMEGQLKDKYPDFKNSRILAESRARSLIDEEDVTLLEIYQNFPRVSKNEAQFLFEKELSLEKMILVLNYEIIEFYNQCVASGKTIFLVSDMYIPRLFLEEVLSAVGICNYSELYLSSDKRKTKFNSTLFKVLFKEQGINPNELIHIGDSWKSDYIIPRNLGMEAIHVPRIIKRGEYKADVMSKDVGKMYLNCFINNTLPVNSDPYFQFGYEKFGMLLWGYAKWNLDTAKQKKCDRLYFFARDGMMMKKAVDICNSDSNINTNYFEVSRKSLRTPLLWIECNLGVVLDMLPPYSQIQITLLMDSLGLDINEYYPILLKYGFDKNATFSRYNALQNKALVQMFEELKPEIIINSKKEYELFKKYINQQDMNGIFAIVDIGWAGSIQRYLIQLLDKMRVNYNIEGFYIGVDAGHKRHLKVIEDLNLNGYLFDISHNTDDIDVKTYFVDLLEFLFIENNGSVKNYKIDDETGLVSGMRYPYEYMIDGKYTEEYECIRRVQKGALSFIENAASDELLNQFDYSANTLFSRIYQAGNAPKQSDLKLFADFRFFEEGLVRRLAAPKSLFYYAIHWKKLRRDFFLSGWKVGFTKRLVRINLPFVKILNMTYKLFVK